MKRIFLHIASGLALLLCAGCATVKILPVEQTGRVEAGAQYAHSSAPRTGCNTAEIYLENHGTETLVFEAPVLNGAALPPMRAKASSALDTVTLDGHALPLAVGELKPDREVVWWQYYPSPELKPGETVACQLNFRVLPTFQRKLELNWTAADAPGTNLPGGPSTIAPAKPGAVSLIANQKSKIENLIVPRFRQPETLITAVTFPLDYSAVYIQYQSQHVPPARLWLNNREVVGFKALPSPEPDTPDLLMVPLNSDPEQPEKSLFPIVTGLPLHVKLTFPDGSERQALVRAQNGVLVDAYEVGAEQVRRELVLDPDPAVVNFKAADGGDVACYGVKQKDHGASAAPVIEERLRLVAEQPRKLAAIHFCTATYPELWNLYGQIADCAYANPYRLKCGENKARFMEEDEECIVKAWQAVRPRPFLWIPEAFKCHARFLEGEELEVMAWMNLVRGAKGVKYYSAGNNLNGYPPALVAAMKNINGEIHRCQAELSPLVLVSERTVSLPSTISHAPSTLNPEPRTPRDARPISRPPPSTPHLSPLKIYTAWSGDRGLLVMVRNLDYKTDGQADDDGRKPRFQVTPKTDITIPVALPAWFRFNGAKDFLTGRPLPAALTGARSFWSFAWLFGRPKEGWDIVEVKLETLDAFALVWLEN